VFQSLPSSGLLAQRDGGIDSLDNLN